VASRGVSAGVGKCSADCFRSPCARFEFRIDSDSRTRGKMALDHQHTRHGLNVNFLVGLGTHKGGTTSFNALLIGVAAITRGMSEHFVHSEPKECHFLETARSVSSATLSTTYETYLNKCWQHRCSAEHNATAVCFEISPRYMFRPDTGFMLSLIPNVKVFALLRDPIARAWSGYLQYAVKDQPLPDFRTLVRAEMQAYPRCATQDAGMAGWPAVQSCVLTSLAYPSNEAFPALRANSSMVRNFGLPVCRGLYAPQLRHLRKSFREELYLMLSEVYFADPVPLLHDLIAWAAPSVVESISASQLQHLVQSAASSKNSRASMTAETMPNVMHTELRNFFMPFNVELRCDYPKHMKSPYATWLPDSCP